MSTSKRYPSAVLSFITGPIRTEFDNGRVILTHLQKFSHFWLMLTFTGLVPTFHFGLMWKLQDYDLGTFVPGTEQGLYFRTPGYRWDAELGMKWTWGYVGGHLD